MMVIEMSVTKSKQTTKQIMEKNERRAKERMVFLFDANFNLPAGIGRFLLMFFCSIDFKHETEMCEVFETKWFELAESCVDETFEYRTSYFVLPLYCKLKVDGSADVEGISTSVLNFTRY